MGFSVCFYILAKGYNSTDRAFSYQSILYMTICQTLGTGDMFELLLLDSDSERVVVKLLFVVYLIVSAIVMLNLLIAMMNDTYNQAVLAAEKQIDADGLRHLTYLMALERRFLKSIASLIVCFLRLERHAGLDEYKLEDQKRENVRWYMDKTTKGSKKGRANNSAVIKIYPTASALGNSGAGKNGKSKEN
jgi:hypothetical protein